MADVLSRPTEDQVVHDRATSTTSAARHRPRHLLRVYGRTGFQNGGLSKSFWSAGSTCPAHAHAHIHANMQANVYMHGHVPRLSGSFLRRAVAD